MGQRIGVVLAGGLGRRMGRPKGSIELDGMTLAERAWRVLVPLCGSVLVSIAPGAANPVPRLPSIEDEPPAGRGPLAGIRAALGVTGQADLLVLACDYPWVTTGLLREILGAARDEDDLVMVYDDKGRDHPLVALWKRSVEEAVKRAIEHRVYKTRSLLADVVVRRLGPPDLPGFDLAAQLRNVNDPEDLVPRS